MNFFDSAYQTLLNDSIIPLPALASLVGWLLLLFVVEMIYHVYIYGGIATFRNLQGRKSQQTPPPISLIVVVRESHFYFVNEVLPLFLKQKYHQYEVVVVDCSYDEEIYEKLQGYALSYPHLRVSPIKNANRIRHGEKLATTVGIKAAKYEHLLFTTANCFPTSDTWLSIMAKGFINGDLLIGYCGIEQRAGLANKLIRCSRLATSVRYLTAAIHKYTYRGAVQNIGYTKSLYFSHNGFNHLNTDLGMDDLFVQYLLPRARVSVVMNPQATLRESQYGGLGGWYTQRRYAKQTYRKYPFLIRVRNGLELAARCQYIVTTLVVLALMPGVWKALPLLFWLTRLSVIFYKTRRSSKRLGERGIVWSYLLYDFLAPLGEFCVALPRLRKAKF